MPIRSYSDVPNKIVGLYLQEVGAEYDRARGFKPYTRATPEILARFDGGCAYCGGLFEAEDHVVSKNKEQLGLHAWGNIAPACKKCNNLKRYRNWSALIDEVAMSPAEAETRKARIIAMQTEYHYAPAIDALRVEVEALYRRADEQARAMVSDAVTASAALIAAMTTDAV